ncbi:MAG: hypothetical protein VX320_02860 [Candidatus Thermoplasmatota archaeon]|nr:hypothetical protein [Candidatus Thermoplasmatota archaeon]
MEGRIKGVLDERMLLFERRDGKGLRIELDSIQRVRHHHVPITPPGITWLGVITIILAARVLSGSIQLYALAVGAITIFTWLIGRKPALCIDTKVGDRHILHGRDSLLLRTQMMVNRLCDGKTMDEAREGLEELHRHSNYPMVRPLESVQMEAMAIGDQIIEDAEILPEPDVFDEADLERALANMYNGREDKIPEPQPANTITTRQATESFSSDSPADHAGRGLLDRARESLNETKESNDWFTPQQEAAPTTSAADTNPWEKPWEPKQEVPSQTAADSAYLRAWGRDEPEWYQERDTGTRIQSALSEAKDAGGFSGSMFDDAGPSQTTDTGIFGNLFDDNQISEPQTYSPIPEPTPLSEPTPTWSGQAIHDARANTALATTLPEPTVHALREECTPGLVAAARMKSNENEIEQHNQAPPRQQELEVLASFPALSAMLKSSPPARLQGNFVQKEGRLTRLARRSMKMLKSMESKRNPRNLQRPVEIKEDDYASTYGDSDGFANGEYQEVPLRSGQILRLRADQDHQAEIADRILSLSRSTGGEFAEDDAGELIQRLSASGDLEPIANLLKAADNNLTFSNLASTSPPKEAPGHHGISRLG